MKHLSKTKYSTGTELEHTGQWSTRTVFVDGTPDLQVVNGLITDSGASHVHINTSVVHAEIAGAVRAILAQGQGVTLEYPAGQQETVQTLLGQDYLDQRFIPLAVVSVNRPDQTNTNFSIKLVDSNPLTSLPGTWVVGSRSVMSPGNLTSWADYDQKIPFHTIVGVNERGVKGVVVETVTPVESPAAESVDTPAVVVEPVAEAPVPSPTTAESTEPAVPESQPTPEPNPDEPTGVTTSPTEDVVAALNTAGRRTRRVK